MDERAHPVGESPEGNLATRDVLRAVGADDLLALATAAPVGLFVAELPTGALFLNDCALEIIGRNRRELAEIDWLTVLHPDERERLRQARDAIARSREVRPSEFECRVQRPDGEVRWVRIRAAPAAVDKSPTVVGSAVDVTDFKRIEDALQQSEGRFRALVEHSFDAITVLEPDGTIRYASPAAARISGFESGSQVNANISSLLHPDDRDTVRAVFARTIAEADAQVEFECRLESASGSWLTFKAVAVNLLDDPDVHGVVVTTHDVTAQRDAEAAIRSSEERQRDQATILEMIVLSRPLPETLAELCRLVERQITRVRCAVLLAEPGATTMRLGAAPNVEPEVARALDHCLADEIPSPARDRILAGWWSTPVQSSADEHLLGAFLTRPEEPRTPDTAETAVIDAAVQLAAIAIERSLFEGRLAHEAHHDGLTGLANRTLFGELLEHALARVQRSGSALAVLFCDLDRFKVVNDSLGHDAGDALLTVIADRLERVLRPGDVVARFGGDEFTILCEDLDRSDAAAHVTAVAERVIDAIREPVNIGSENQEQFVSASIGIALAGTGKERPEDLLRDADAAMYRAKERGRGRWELFDQRMRDRAQARHEVENALHRAVARGEFTVYYQPVVALRSGVCIGVEALVRWLHPDRGLLTPGEFLHVADDTGLIIDIGGGVLDQACPEVAQWRRMLADGDEFRLRVNLSGRQLMHPETADLVAGVLARTGLRPDALCIEITETVLVEDLAAGVAAVNALKVLGVRVSVDDFGTGYSALDYLRRFPIDDVKIDRRFVGRLGRAPQDVAIVAAIANLGHALGVTVTAEGVETADQLTALRKLDVDAAQGFLFAPPQPAADLTARLLRPHSWI